MKRIVAILAVVSALVLSACAGGGVKVQEQNGAKVSEVKYEDGVVSGTIKFDDAHSAVTYGVEAAHEQNGELSSNGDAFTDVTPGEEYEFSYELYELSYQGTLNYFGGQDMGQLMRSILDEGEVYLNFWDADSNLLIRLRLQ